jgi:hypothetical protein
MSTGIPMEDAVVAVRLLIVKGVSVATIIWASNSSSMRLLQDLLPLAAILFPTSSISS